jgi:Cyclic nucleotide-binding domain
MHGQIDMRTFARGAGATVTYAAGAVIFQKGDPGTCMYIVQSGIIEMVIGDKVVETCGANEAIGFMSMIDGAQRSSTAPRPGGVRGLADRPAPVPLHGRRGAELRAVHHGCHGAAYPRHGRGDVALKNGLGCREDGVGFRARNSETMHGR